MLCNVMYKALVLAFPMQVLSTRARKAVNVADIKVDVCTFAFDCLYLNGRPLLREPLSTRKQALVAALNPQPGVLQLSEAKVCGCCALAVQRRARKEAVHIGRQIVVYVPVHDMHMTVLRCTWPAWETREACCRSVHGARLASIASSTP